MSPDEKQDNDNQDESQTGGVLQGRRVAFVGKLASMARREASELAREHGATVVDKPGADVNIVVLSEDQLPVLESSQLDDWFDDAARAAMEQGTLEVIGETQLWQRLGLVGDQQDMSQLHTPAMLAEMLDVPVAIVRRWHRRGLISPVREVRRLPYFDFAEVATARRLAELLATGMTPAAIEKKLAALQRYMPGVERPIAQLSVIIEGRRILLRQGDGLIEPGGQLLFDFEDAEPAAPPAKPTPSTAEEMCSLAAELEEDGQLEAAAEMYRAAMAAGGPKAEICFQVAELLYRSGDAAGARERYYMAIELDENYVEARANLGCVLAELGQKELAVAAFEGALRYHADYADVHYQLARTLDDLGQPNRARTHWERFVELAPDSPWVEEARGRISGQ